MRFFAAAASNEEWEHVYCAAIVAANTSMRPVEVKHLRRCDVDLVKKILHVRRSKNETSHRVIPLNTSALNAVARMFERADMLDHTGPEHYLWPACQWGCFDPTQPMLKWDGLAGRCVTPRASRGCGSTICTTRSSRRAEMGVADHVLESITGHLSRRMLERYSHIRGTPNARRSTPWTCTVGACCLKQATARAATRRTSKSSPLSTCPTTSRQSHVTVCC